MDGMENEISNLQIEKKIFVIRGVQVMIDRDIAELYGVETRILNQAVKRNLNRFPEEFMFQMNDEEFDNWKSQIVISSWGGIRKAPFVFTEHGVTMLASVLKSETAVKASIQIVKAFVSMRHFVQSNSEIFAELKSIRQHQIETDVHLNESDKKIDQLFTLMDKYNVKVTIYTDPKTKLTSQDVQNFNAQYPSLTLNYTTKMHDRFMIIDNKILYHIGASLKDLGKKCFAFEILDASIIQAILQNL